MSLLMEALRKAEQAKQRMQQETEAARGGLDASGNPSTSSSSFTLEEREASVTPEYLRDTFAGVQDADAQDDIRVHDESPDAIDAFADEAGAHARHAAQRQQRAAAASVFAAKQKPAHSRKTLALLVTIMVLMVPVGGGILWYLLAANTSSIGLNPALANYDLSSRSFADTPTDTPANTAASGANPVAAAPVVAATTDAVPAVEGTGEAAAAGSENDEATEAATRNAASAPPEPEAGFASAAPVQAPEPVSPSADADLALPANTPAPVLEISRSRGTPQVDPDLASAYARLQEGDIAGAGALYGQVLATLPNNRDALLGMALVHMREGRSANARKLYARLLELNPRDPLAQIGLLQTMPSGSPAEHENVLRSLIAQFPNVAQLTLALGNHYAAQGRWSEAQAAYYNALLTARRSTGGPVHPDYAFNLAVSLEQLDQPQAALDYYRQAQALAAEVTPGFDIQLLNSRLTYLVEQAPR
ncbi:MAG: tetratricopeptide repeat protein [Gammaproteobacteria bacterium]